MEERPSAHERRDLREHGWWQARLAARFFSPSRAGQRVRLSIDADDFPIDGAPVESLVQAVKAETEITGCGTILELLAFQARQFESTVKHAQTNAGPNSLPAPNVLPGLAILVLATHYGGSQFAANNYYDRLRAFMGYSPAVDIESTHMRRAGAAWTALERWSCQHLLGRRGLFEPRALGGMRYIGIPLRQALLSPEDESALLQAFAAGGIEPGLQISASAAHRFARQATLRARARKVLSEYPTSAASRELIDDVLVVYEAWSGHGTENENGTVAKRPMRLRFTLRGRRLEDIVATCLVPSDVDYLPSEGDLTLRLKRTERRDGSAEVIRQDGTSLAEDLDWFRALECRFKTSAGAALKCFREQRDCRWFLNSGGPHWIERFEDELEPGQNYVEIRRTGAQAKNPGTGSGQFHDGPGLELEKPAGLHAKMFRHESSTPHNTERRVALRMHGGIRITGQGHLFYDFALPEIQWPHREDSDNRLVMRLINDRGEVLTESLVEPEAHKKDWQGFGSSHQSDTTQLQAPIQNAVDAFLDRGLRPALAEVFLPEDEQNSKLRIFLETSPPTVSPPPPPGRNCIGALDDSGPLFGPFGEADHGAAQYIPTPQLGRPLQLREPVISRHSPHSRVCQLLRSRGTVPWGQARSQVRQCGRDDSFNDRYSLTSQMSSLHQMGLIELIESDAGGFASVQALPPRLAVTVAQANLGMRNGTTLTQGKRFLLTGAWLPKELDRLRREVSSSRSLIFHANSGPDHATLLPPERFIIATDARRGISELRNIAGRLGVQFEENVPDALSSLGSMAPITAITSLLDWRPGIPGAGYDTYEFDPDRICRTRQGTNLNQLRLRECKNRQSGLWVFFVVDVKENRHARIHDRQLGRWLIRLHHAHDLTLPIDREGALLVPLELRLPRHLERAFALESGRPPETVWFQIEGPGSPFLDPHYSKRFRIPPPDTVRIRPYETEDRCSHAFLRYPGVTALWPMDQPMPILECRAELVPTMSLHGEKR